MGILSSSKLIVTSNATTSTEARSASARLFASMWRPLVSVITTLLLCCDYFSSSSVVLRAFSVLCVYSKFGHHPHPLGYLCAKFCFFRGLHCGPSPSRNIPYSITQSITHPAYLMPQEPKHLCFVTITLTGLQYGVTGTF